MCLSSGMTITKDPYNIAMFSVDSYDGIVSVERNDFLTDAEAETICAEIQKHITSDFGEAIGLAGGKRKKSRKQRQRKRKNTRKNLRKH